MADRIRGTLYGQAIGDSLGIPDEFKSKDWIAVKYGPDNGPTEYVSTRGFKAGEWSDDTAMAVAILETYLQHRGMKGKTVMDRGAYRTFSGVPQMTDIAHAFWEWLIGDGRGSGNLTRNVMTDPMFLTNPHDAAHRIWIRRARNSAANGAVMRTSYLALLNPSDLNWVERHAVDVARVTHWDPRCVASAVAVSIAVAALVSGATIEQAIDLAEERAVQYDSEVGLYMDMSLEELDLDEGLDEPDYKGRPPIGFTYKTLGAGFWALRSVLELRSQRMRIGPSMFSRILQRVLLEGGDVDTNGAVAGALLGAAFGIENMPTDLVEGIYEREKLEGFAEQLNA